MGWFLLNRFVDLLRKCYLHIINRNHSNTLLLINLQKTKTCLNKVLQQRLFILILGFSQCRQVFVHYKAGRKTRRRRTHTNAKHYVFHAKAIIYCCVLFDQTGNTDDPVQWQHLAIIPWKNLLQYKNSLKYKVGCF